MQSPSRFFGGEASSLGTVSKLGVSSWKHFVQEILGHPAIVNVTRAQFAALPKDRRNAVKRVPYVTPATFRTDEDAKRVTANAKDISILALDIDDPAQARPFFRNPEIVRQALEPLSFAIYTTASSTEEDPKLRIFVPADHIPVRLYPSAVKTVGRLLGLTKITTESLVPVQPMYLPTLFRDDDPEEQRPLLASAVAGNSFTEDMISVQPTEEDKPARHKNAALDDDDDLDYLRAAVDDVTLEDTSAALVHLDPDCGYMEWLEIAAALRHQFPTKPDEAYFQFDRWSSLGKKYAGKKDTRAKWDSLRPTPKGRAPITVRTLFHKATANGWDGAARVAAKAYESVMAWISAPERTPNELMSLGPKRILAAPLQSAIERGTLVNRLRDSLTAKNHKVSMKEIRTEMRKLETKLSTVSTKPEPESELPKWAHGLCYVAAANEFYQRTGDKRFSPEVLDNVFGVQLMAGGTESGRPVMRPRDFLLNVAKIPRVDHYRYDPSHPEKTFFSLPGSHRYVNLYLPTYPEPNPDDAEEAGEIFTTHLTNLIAEPEYRATMLDFLAYHVQFPGHKVRWAVLLQGTQGCGKTAIAEAMRGVLGSSNIKVMDAALLFTPFNNWAMGAQMVFMEEIRVVGHNRHEVMNRLKPCISNDTVMIRQMRMDAYQTPNMTNYMMFTNHHDSLAVTEGDRRYFVVNSVLQNKEQVQALGRKYFPRLFRMITTQAAGLRSFLQDHRISETFQPHGHAPHTKYMKELTYAAAAPLTMAVRDILQDGPHPLVKRDLVSTKCLKPLLDLENLARFSDQQLAASLRELDYVQHGRFRLDDGRHYIWTKRNAFTNTAAAEKAVAERASPVGGKASDLL